MLGIIDGAALDVIVIFMLFIIVISVIGMLVVLLKNRPSKNETEKDYLYISETLRNSLEDFGQRLEKSMKETMNELGNRITGSGMQVNLSSQVLDDTVDKFDQSIKGLTEIVNNIKEYN
jgi:methyl-accepting chemotaxis protein